MKTENHSKPNSSENSNENKKGIENHKKAAEHLKEASQHHEDAAKHHESGDHAKAAQSTILAHGHHSLAIEAEREDVKHHALNK